MSRKSASLMLAPAQPETNVVKRAWLAVVAWLTVLAAMLGAVAAQTAPGRQSLRVLAMERREGKWEAAGFVPDSRAEISMGALTGMILGILGLILGAVIGLKLLASLTPTFFGAVESINENLTTVTTGDDTGDDILAIFPIVIAVAAVVAFVVVIFRVLNL